MTGRTYDPATGQAIAELGLDPEEVVTVTRGYIAQVHLDAKVYGLKRGLELAKEHATLEADTRGIGISWRAADAAVDKECG